MLAHIPPLPLNYTGVSAGSYIRAVLVEEVARVSVEGLDFIETASAAFTNLLYT